MFRRSFTSTTPGLHLHQHTQLKSQISSFPICIPCVISRKASTSIMVLVANVISF